MVQRLSRFLNKYYSWISTICMPIVNKIYNYALFFR